VRERLASAEAAPSSRVLELEQQSEAILRLEGDFRGIVEKHNAWQQIEHTLRTIETTISASFEQLEFLWPGLRDDVRPLFSPLEAQWERDLSAACEALDACIQNRDPLRAGEAQKRFRQIRRLCAIHFLKVGEELRDVCSRVGRVGESIALLAGMLDTP